MTITSAAAHGDIPMTADTLRLLSRTQKSKAPQSQGLTGYFWTTLRGFVVFISLPVTLWNLSRWEHLLRLYGWWQMGLPHRITAHWWPSSHFSSFGLCVPLRRGSVTTESCFSCSSADTGNKRIKRTHRGKRTSGLNCWTIWMMTLWAWYRRLGTGTHASDRTHCKNSPGRGKGTDYIRSSYYVLC